MRPMLIIITLMCVVISSFAHADTTPHYFHYQSKLLDEAGNPVPDGSASVMFRVIGPDDHVLYQEQQSLDVVNGEAAALLGNGLDPASGAPTGGLSVELFTPGESRYLEVEVEGYPPTGQMEIVSVPYALYAERSLGVAAGAIDSAAIAEKSVELRHFGDATLQDLADALLDQGLLTPGVTQADLTTTYREPTGATQIGVASGLVYSAENNLQGVLRDLDRAIDKRQVNIDEEARLRTEANTTLQTNINAEADLRDAADDALELNKLSRAGGTMTGNITMDPGTTVDGYDISTTINNINNIAGTLGEPKIDTTIARDTEFQAADTVINASITAINATLTDINNIPGTLDKLKIDNDIARDTELSTAVAAEAGLRSAADATKLSLSGGTMTGDITMGVGDDGTPVTVDGYDVGVVGDDFYSVYDATPIVQKIRDEKIADTITRDTELATKLDLAGGTMTGNFNVQRSDGGNVNVTVGDGIIDNDTDLTIESDVSVGDDLIVNDSVTIGGVRRTTWPNEADGDDEAKSVSKAWVNFTTDGGGNVTMNESYHVSSVTGVTFDDDRCLTTPPIDVNGCDHPAFKIMWNRSFDGTGYIVVFGVNHYQNVPGVDTDTANIPNVLEKTRSYVIVTVNNDDETVIDENLDVSVLAFGLL